MNINLIVGTGPNGRVTKNDVLAFISDGDAEKIDTPSLQTTAAPSIPSGMIGIP